METIILKPGREKSLIRKHPWIFSGAIKSSSGNVEAGDFVKVLDCQNHFLGIAGFNPASSICGRVFTFDDVEIDKAFFMQRVLRATELRRELRVTDSTNAYRIVNAESDGLPGLILDSYPDHLVVQLLTATMDRYRELILDSIQEVIEAKNIYERSDSDVRGLEGLESISRIARGKNPPDSVEIIENGVRFLVDIKNGHKTGFYLDQRENRDFCGKLAIGKNVLNCFCYTGGFSIFSLNFGADSVTSIDASQEAIKLAQENQFINGLGNLDSDWILGDVFKLLRGFRDAGKKYDLIILDPPKFASTPAQVNSAARGYKDINLLAFKLLNPGGILITFSCSGGVNKELFQKIVSDAALDANVDASIVKRLSQSSDHPVSLNFPEAEYLKGLVCLVKK